MDKGHLIAYAASILGLIVVLVALLMGNDVKLSLIEEPASVATSTIGTMLETVGPTTNGQEGPFRFEIVSTPAAREQGLSGRREVPEDYGMLFIFPTAAAYGFWMKDMHVSIDIIWLADDGRILSIEEAVSPDTYPQSFHPPQPVRYVLETRAGEAQRQGWDVGTRIELPLP